MVGFREQLILADGSVIFYHEGRLETGEPFHLLTRVQGKMLKPYLEFIRSSQNFRIADLERWATIIRCANGALEKDEIHRIVRDTYPST